jgi:hypothetical protein
MRHSNTQLIIFVVVIMVLNSCHKDRFIDPYQITGHVYRSCPKQPVTDAPIQLFKFKSGFLTTQSDIITSTKTDGNGYFKLETNSGEILALAFSNGDEIIHDMKPESNIGLEIYQLSSTTLNIFLNVTNHYSSSDTLFIAASDSFGNQLTVVGPFNSGFLTAINNYQLKGNIVLNSMKYSSKPTISYHVNRNANSAIADINLNLCDTSTTMFNIN